MLIQPILGHKLLSCLKFLYDRSFDDAASWKIDFFVENSRPRNCFGVKKLQIFTNVSLMLILRIFRKR